MHKIACFVAMSFSESPHVVNVISFLRMLFLVVFKRDDVKIGLFFDATLEVEPCWRQDDDRLIKRRGTRCQDRAMDLAAREAKRIGTGVKLSSVYQLMSHCGYSRSDRNKKYTFYLHLLNLSLY